MKCSELIRASRKLLNEKNCCSIPIRPLDSFNRGGEWMRMQMSELRLVSIPDRDIPFTFYGLLKYGICLMACFVSALVLYQINPLIVPISIIVFYVFEVHLLFLFPLLIDGAERPIYSSIVATYKIGVFRALLAVMPIGFIMILGLLKREKRLENWYIGCLSVIIWYENEVRNRA